MFTEHMLNMNEQVLSLVSKALIFYLWYVYMHVYYKIITI